MVRQAGEQRLVIDFKNGDHHSFKVLYQKYAPRLYGFAKKYLNSGEDAEEIVQEVFLKIWEKKDNIDENQAFSAYLFQSAKNRIFNGFRKRVNEQAYLNHLIYASQENMNFTERDIQYEAVKLKIEQLVAAMPSKRQEIFRLSRESGLKNKEIAEKLNISIKTVENQMGAALKYLKKAFEN
jgi:RNA polymerase sigma-70 factor (ECF subfamily)